MCVLAAQCNATNPAADNQRPAPAKLASSGARLDTKQTLARLWGKTPHLPTHFELASAGSNVITAGAEIAPISWDEVVALEPGLARAMVEGYVSVRPLAPEERSLRSTAPSPELPVGIDLELEL